jgi:hypothetical protein
VQIPEIVAPLLIQLLRESGPEKAARLKQRLIGAFAEKGLGRFDEKLYGYFKFKDFLERAFGELVHIDKEGEGGDISVSLRDAKDLPATPDPQPPVPVVRNDVWQAFSNPDPGRRRFFKRADGSIVHFKRGEAPELEAIANSSPDSVEITPIPGQAQLVWMDNFLSSLQLPEDERSTLLTILKGSYSSGLNLTFTRALGGNAEAWKRFRRDRVLSEVKGWSEKNSVDAEQLWLQGKKLDAPNSVSAPREKFSPDVREQATRLLALLSEEDIAKAVMPTILTTILIRSRL